MENKVRQAHGANRGAHCSVCTEEQDAKVLKKAIKDGNIMRCTKCKTGPVKPDIVFFGEGLPRSFFDAQESMENKKDETP